MGGFFGCHLNVGIGEILLLLFLAAVLVGLLVLFGSHNGIMSVCSNAPITKEGEKAFEHLSLSLPIGLLLAITDSTNHWYTLKDIRN
jgi:hypothetical protein